jgi:hypothetical protein
MFPCINIPQAPRGQKKLDWLPMLGDHEMPLETIDIPLLAGNLASKLLARVELSVFDPAMVTRRNRQTSNHIEAVTIPGFPSVSSQLAHENEALFHTMQSAIQATLAQHLRYIVMLFQHPAGPFKIPAQEKCRRKGRRQHFSIPHLTLRVFLMTHGMYQIVTQTVRRYNFLVHGLPPLWGQTISTPY